MKNNKNIAIIGGGPSGLMAAEIIATAGHTVTIYDAMPSVGRKFLLAGRGGLNLTHSEPLEKFLTRYYEASNWLEPSIRDFDPQKLRKIRARNFYWQQRQNFPAQYESIAIA